MFEEHIVLGTRYIHKSDHRSGSEKKSQWIISKESERLCFTQSPLLVDNLKSRWGLHFENSQVSYLGKSKSENPPIRSLLIAKFVHDKQNDYWHGYPGDHEENNQDIPPEEVTKFWQDKGYLSKAKISKINGGKRCKL